MTGATLAEPHLHIAPSATQPGMSIDELRALCARYPHPKFLQGDAIPAKKAINSRRALGLLPTDEIAGLIDFTTFGSANHALVFATSGIYFSNSGSPALSLSWKGLKRVSVKPSSDRGRQTSVAFSDGVHINCSGAQDLVNSHIAPLITDLIAHLNTLPDAAHKPAPIKKDDWSLDSDFDLEGSVDKTVPVDLDDFNFDDQPSLASDDPDLRGFFHAERSTPAEAVKASAPASFRLPVPSRLEVGKPQADASGDSQPDSRSSLVILVGRHGERFSNDPQICRAILNDVGRNFSKRELNALVGAVSLNIPARIVGDSSGAPWSARRHQLAQLMHSDLGLLEKLAYWCVDGWALALGKISDDELGIADSATRAPAPTGAAAAPMPTTNAKAVAPHIHVRLVSIDGDDDDDDDYVDVNFEVINGTSVNFTDLSIELNVFDVDGDMITKDSISGRLKPTGRYQATLGIDCHKSELGKIVLERIDSFSQINGKYLRHCSAADKAVLEVAAVTTDSLVTAVEAQAPAGVVWDWKN